MRVDPQDNVWVVDQLSTQVIKFDPNGRIQMVFSRKPEAMRVPNLPLAVPADTYALVGPRPPQPPAGEGRGGGAAAPAGGGARRTAAGLGRRRVRTSTVRPTSRGIRRATSTSPTATATRASRSTTATASGSRTGARPAPSQGQFRVVHGIQIDAANNVYVADRDNRRIQVFDTEGTFKTQFRNVGSPWAICITPGPRQFLYVSNSNPPNNLDYDGEILKMTLDGTIVGKFGRAGKLLKEFGTVNAIDCRSENELYVGELGNWRVQKVTLRPTTTATR